MKFSPYDWEDYPLVEVVRQFQYIGKTLEHTDNDCPAVQHNIGKKFSVWHSLVKLLRQEGSDNQVSALFYRAVIQVVLLFESDSWVLLDVMTRMAESTRVGFLRHIMGKWLRQQASGSWGTPAPRKCYGCRGYSLRPHIYAAGRQQ